MKNDRFIKKSNQGDVQSRHNPGIPSTLCDSVEQSCHEGLKSIRKSAKLGDPYAQHTLGYNYAHGLGLKQSEKESVKWYRKSAKQGLAESQLCLGFAYIYGQGVVRNLQTAYRWLLLASEGGDNLASAKLVAIEKVLSPVQQKAGRSWVKRINLRSVVLP
jgi:TPR repeat protein